MATPEQIKTSLNTTTSNAPGDLVYERNWLNWCQALVYQMCRLHGTAPKVYPSATAAYNASKIESTNPALAPAGAIHYWKNPTPHGHVGIDIHGKGTHILMGSNHIDTNWVEKGVGRGTAGTVSATKYTQKMGGYLGWSLTNGANRINISNPVPPPLLPNQRQVGTVETRLRTEPTTAAPYNAKENLKPSAIITPEGWVTGQKVDNIDIWYKTDKGYAWAGGFTNKTSDNLTDLNRTPVDDALDLLRSAKLDNVEATKRLTESSDKIEQAIKLIEGTQNQ